MSWAKPILMELGTLFGMVSKEELSAFKKDEAQKEAAFAIYEDLKALKVDVCLDNRDERSGVKFKDADLIGFPIRVVIGKSLAEGNVEIKIRKTGEMVVCSVKEAAQEVNRLLKSLS